MSLRQVIAWSAAEVPRFEIGSRVRVTFGKGARARRYPGAVSDRRDHLYTITFDDGDVRKDVEERKLQPVSDDDDEGIKHEPPAEAIAPSIEQLGALADSTAALPAPTLEKVYWPGGLLHCGGDLCFPNLTLAHKDHHSRSWKMPLFMMRPGAMASFPGATTCHGTTAHHNVASRLDGCEAHVSFAVQTPVAAFGVGSRSAARWALHSNLLDAGYADARERWSDAVWLPVWHFDQVPPPVGHLYFSDHMMEALPWIRIVLYDVESGPVRTPLVFYDADGGLKDDTPASSEPSAGGEPVACASASSELTTSASCEPVACASASIDPGASSSDTTMAAFARSHFAFLHDQFRFSLNRHSSESFTSGCLNLDPMGEQRMEMLGVRSQRRNAYQPPERRRPGLEVTHPGGDLDAYVVHHDEPARFKPATLRPLWNAIGRRMHRMLPRASQAMVDALEEANVRERLHSAIAAKAISDDLLVNNVGVSAAYQSPPHVDVGDVGWTFAVACKCGATTGKRAADADPLDLEHLPLRKRQARLKATSTCKAVKAGCTCG